MRARVHGQLGAVHYGGARARGRAALFLQVMAIAAVSAPEKNAWATKVHHDGAYKYIGGVLGPNGLIYFVPSSADNIGIQGHRSCVMHASSGG